MQRLNALRKRKKDMATKKVELVMSIEIGEKENDSRHPRYNLTDADVLDKLLQFIVLNRGIGSFCSDYGLKITSYYFKHGT